MLLLQYQQRGYQNKQKLFFIKQKNHDKMVYENLSIGLQTLLEYQYLEFSKFITIVLAILLSILYIWVWKPKEKDTSLWFKIVPRIGFTSMSWVTIFLSPMLLFFLHPAFDYWIWFRVWFSFYGIFALLFIIMAFIDVLRNAPSVILYLGGINKGSPEVKEVMKNLFPNRRFK